MVSSPERAEWNNLSHWGGKVLQGRRVNGTLEDGRTICTTIVAHTGYQPVLPDWDFALEYLIDNTVIDNGSCSDVKNLQCRFTLTNVSLRLCDEVTELPLPPGLDPAKVRPGRSHNRVTFVLGHREWILIDKTVGASGNAPPSNANALSLTATLSTAISTLDEVAKLRVVADKICELLSFALSQDVTWPSLDIVDPTGKALHTEARHIFCRPHSNGGSGPIENYKHGELKGFIETAFPRCEGNAEWWHKTLVLYHEVQMAAMVEVKAVLLYILADRISESLLSGENLGGQIHPDLGETLNKKSFFTELHEVLSRLDGWDENRTRSVIGVIKSWNARPPLPEKVRLACEKLAVKPPENKLIKPRNRLLHDWELELEQDLIDYWKELECLVLIMLLVMLGYDGTFYHLKLGSETRPLKDFQRSKETPPDQGVSPA